MRLVPPITPAEFLYHLQRCIPPNGWRPSIAVANSGGPDSTALLFLLTATCQLGDHAPIRTVHSVHVNHGLQDAASAMERTATSTAERFGAPSVVQTIPWGTSPFPDRPEEGSPGEERLIREARYNLLFAAMRKTVANAMAFAHHADDQVETAIMRMSQGSSNHGLAGMRPVRRWGMGHKDRELYQFGTEGMQSWIVRPFLQVPKDRLLATCEANKLDYVNDPTNFQPGLTVRNAIRHTLSSEQQGSAGPVMSLQEETFDAAPYVTKLRALVPNSPPSEQLRDAVRLFSNRLEEIEIQVTNVLAKARRPSAPSTLLLTDPGLALATTPEVRTALIRRCLRYVSHGPWGSIWAEASGEREAFERIAQKLWPSPNAKLEGDTEIDGATVTQGENDATTAIEDESDSATATQDESDGATANHDERQNFTAGAGVVATRVTILPGKEDTIRLRPAKEGELKGWVFMREPHYRFQGGEPATGGILDVTDVVMNALRTRDKATVLYDHRFAMTFTLDLLPRTVEEELIKRQARVLIEPDTKWALPRVILVGKKTTRRCIGKYLWHIHGWNDTCKRPVKFQRWIAMDFIRSLDAI